MWDFLYIVATLCIIFIVICMMFGLAVMSHKYVKKIPIGGIAILYTIILFLIIDYGIPNYSFDVFETSHLLSSNILSVFFFGILLNAAFSIEDEEKTTANPYVSATADALVQFLISQNILWYVTHKLGYDYLFGILLNILLWCLAAIGGDIQNKCKPKYILSHCVSTIVTIFAGGYLYLVSGNILYPIALVIGTIGIKQMKKVKM